MKPGHWAGLHFDCFCDWNGPQKGASLPSVLIRKTFDSNVSEEDVITNILKADVSSTGFGKILSLCKRRLRHGLVPSLVPDPDVNDFFAVQPVLDVIPADDDPRLVECPIWF